MGQESRDPTTRSDNTNQKLMLFSFALLFIAWSFAGFLHVYARCCERRRRLRHVSTTSSRGLDLSVVNAIPNFVFESKSEEHPTPGCAVCLSDFEDREAVRVMPECNHFFHAECIDTWLQSHADCPLCRTRVKVSGIGDPAEISQENTAPVPVSSNPGPWW
ncbi:hypothetical protein OROHE_025670 [Orobanche hederae]